MLYLISKVLVKVNFFSFAIWFVSWLFFYLVSNKTVKNCIYQVIKLIFFSNAQKKFHYYINKIMLFSKKKLNDSKYILSFVFLDIKKRHEELKSVIIS